MEPTAANPPAASRRPEVALLAAAGCCLVLALLPGRWMAPVKSAAADCLQPAQVAIRAARSRAAAWGAQAAAWGQNASQAALREAELARLREQNQRLAAELAQLRLAAEISSDTDRVPRLVRASTVEARVLGRQALAFLSRNELLDVGRAAGVEPAGLVVTPPSIVLDCGRDRSLEPGQIVADEVCVWGRIAEVGRWTSLVRRLDEPGYRDLVQIVGQRAAQRGVRRGPQGVLEGTGGQLARISRVEVSEPVEVGDLVYTVCEAGLLPRPVLYGRVARLERPVGSAYWEIWMAPAAGRQVPDRLSVLTLRVSPLRTAAASRGLEDGR